MKKVSFVFTKDSPLSITSAWSAFWGRSFAASQNKPPSFSFSLSSSSLSFDSSKSGLFETFINFVINARDLAVGPEISVLRESWPRRTLRIEICSWVGFTNMIYSTWKNQDEQSLMRLKRLTFGRKVV